MEKCYMFCLGENGSKTYRCGYCGETFTNREEKPQNSESDYCKLSQALQHFPNRASAQSADP